MEQLFVFWQFNGDNRSYCNLSCPECYGRDIRDNQHYWNGDIDKWEEALTRLDLQHGNGGLYLVFSYGEALGSRGFYECVDMIERHPTWTLCIVTNFMLDPTRLLQSRLAKHGRLFVTASWHPEGVADRVAAWEVFKSHLLQAKAAGVPVHVMYCWMKPNTHLFPEYFRWLDANDFRVGVRRFVYDQVGNSTLRKILRNVAPSLFAGKIKLENYSKAERGFIYAYTCPKVTAYGLNLEDTFGKVCHAGKDMVLVKFDGTVTLCACCTSGGHELGNVFDADFKLLEAPLKCPTHSCGGDFGMLVLEDERFGELPKQMWRDNFVSQVEGIRQGSPVAYPKRLEMLEALEALKREK